jgi:hypothetical protein
VNGKGSLAEPFLILYLVIYIKIMAGKRGKSLFPFLLSTVEI